ncbi:dienelactone hydrolase family protein [Hydrogenophaga sp.]|uniref:dienelactone hydrolase family protein n=1 Tax=Hydrogenophaga sp. TaxID=1904254 RepID=UPI0019B58908|nr:dienelactone hydrolase family protein [Hydrogenophaga sp.]MBD3893472.1 dienelactone hydrolase family protein [Hydrogenophaga sp.]
MGRFIPLAAADGWTFTAYEALPAGTPRAGLVLLQEIFGVNSHIRSVADAYASAGYRVLAPSTFSRVQTGVELGYTEADMGLGFGLKTAVDALPEPGVLADIQAAIDHVGSAGKVGIMGFCWGGLLSWRAACRLQGLSAAVCYYGAGMTVAPDAQCQPKVAVLAHFGDQDPWITPASVAAFQAAQPAVQVQVYSAQHGFNCDQRASFDAGAAQLARERTLAFWAQHLQA